MNLLVTVIPLVSRPFRVGLVFKRAGVADYSVTVSQTGFPSSMLESQLLFSYQRQLFHLTRDLAFLKSHLRGYCLSFHCVQHFPALRAYPYDQNNYTKHKSNYNCEYPIKISLFLVSLLVNWETDSRKEFH